MPEITDEYMQTMLGQSKTYTLVMLRDGPNAEAADRALIWEHGRRNFSLRADGVLALVGPLLDDGPWRGLGVFDASVDEASKIMDDDPAVRAGVFEYEAYTWRSFPGDSLPGD